MTMVNWCRFGVWVIACMLSAGASAAPPGKTADQDDLRRRLAELEARDAAKDRAIEEMQAELAALRATDSDPWFTDRRAEEMRSLISDVLADADTRRRLLHGGTAGYDHGFYLASGDGRFRLNLKGLVQTRFIVNHRDGDTVDGTESGFQINRANLFLSGHISDPRIKYLIVLASDAARSFVAESAWASYDINDTLTIGAGRFRNKAFLREERISYTKQLTVERSTMNEVFTLDYVEGVWLTSQDERLRWQAAFHDGARSSGTDFQLDRTDFAANGRVDLLVAGTWAEADTFTALGTADTSIMAGAAVHYERGETGTSPVDNNFLSWTVDGSFEAGGFAVYASVVGRHSDNDSGVDVNQLGFLAQVSLLLDEKLEPFARYEYIDYDGFVDVGAKIPYPEDSLSIVTGGFNYYINGHATKLTLDVMYAFDPVPTARSFTGFLADEPGRDGQYVVRTQLQILF